MSQAGLAGGLEVGGVKLTELYPERQGRPASITAVDMDKRQSSLTISEGSLTILSLETKILTYEGEVLTHNGSTLYRS